MRREGWGSAAGLYALLCLAAGRSGASQGGGGGGLPQPAALSAKALAGEALFHDSSLSASGRQSCASCHVRELAFSADPVTDRGLPVPLGGRNMDLPGFRNAPSLVYAALTSRDINNNSGNNPTPVAAGPLGNPYFSAATPFLAAHGSPDLYQYNDLPVAFDGNVNIGEIPYPAPRFDGGQSLTLEQEIDDLVAFLCTLTDGYDPKNPGAYDVPAQCLPGAR